MQGEDFEWRFWHVSEGEILDFPFGECQRAQNSPLQFPDAAFSSEEDGCNRVGTIYSCFYWYVISGWLFLVVVQYQLSIEGAFVVVVLTGVFVVTDVELCAVEVVVWGLYKNFSFAFGLVAVVGHGILGEVVFFWSALLQHLEILGDLEGEVHYLPHLLLGVEVYKEVTLGARGFL
jgi:hypothetical protein